jgi:hypothetical protein
MPFLFKALLVLVLSQTMVTEIGIEAIVLGCPQLNELALDGCENVSDATTEVLATHGYKSLTIVDLNECDVSDAGMAALAAGCPDLSEVCSESPPSLSLSLSLSPSPGSCANSPASTAMVLIAHFSALHS